MRVLFVGEATDAALTTPPRAACFRGYTAFPAISLAGKFGFNLIIFVSYSFHTPLAPFVSHRLNVRVDWRKGQIGPTSMRRLGESCDYTLLGYAHVTVFDNAEMFFRLIAWADSSVFQLKRAVRRGYILGNYINNTQYLRSNR